MLRIEKRTASFGGNLNVRTGKHGDDDVIGVDVPVTMHVPAGRALANLLIGESADALLWRDNGHGELEPRYSGINAIGLSERIESVRVEVWPRGLDSDSIVLPAANLKSVRLSPLPGGVLELAFKLQSNPYGDEHAALVDCLNRDVEIALECKQFKAQAALALNSPTVPADAPLEVAVPDAPKRKRGQPQLDA
jgi:hypothetical protein